MATKYHKYYIDFSGYCTIEADSADEAEAKFWKGLRPPTEDCFDDVWDIDGIEMVTDRL